MKRQAATLAVCAAVLLAGCVAWPLVLLRARRTRPLRWSERLMRETETATALDSEWRGAA